MARAARAEQIDRYGVIGHPVQHSLSPLIQGLFAEQTGQAMEYERVLAPRDGFTDVAQQFFAAGGRGLNVTVPFKLEATRFAGRCTDRARRAGAVNTLALDAGGVWGDNTDGIGFIRDLGRLGLTSGFQVADSRILVLGAGGAARGITVALLDAGVASIEIASRDLTKAQAMVSLFASPAIASRALPLDDYQGPAFDLVVNATSAGLSGLAVEIPQWLLGEAQLVYDLGYGSGTEAPSTPFLRRVAGQASVGIADGLGMLVEQAAESFLIWRGIRPETATVLAALRDRSRCLQ